MRGSVVRFRDAGAQVADKAAPFFLQPRWRVGQRPRRACASLHSHRPQPRCRCCRPKQAAPVDPWKELRSGFTHRALGLGSLGVPRAHDVLTWGRSGVGVAFGARGLPGVPHTFWHGRSSRTRRFGVCDPASTWGTRPTRCISPDTGRPDVPSCLD
jgi:hypothetical protein